MQLPHKVPFAWQSKFKKYFQTFPHNSIIADVDEPTDWVHNIVVVEKKNGQLRICFDPKLLNAMILHEHFSIPPTGDFLSQFSSNILFTVIDMNDTYWHVELTFKSLLLTSFYTP